MKGFLLLIFLFVTSSFAVEQQTRSSSDGNDLLPRCQAMINAADDPNWKSTHEAFSVGFCTGLVEGIIYASSTVCTPKGVTVLQSARVVVKFLEDNPDKLNLDERALADTALTKAFPCSRK
jgi:Rap1a immunity proteins